MTIEYQIIYWRDIPAQVKAKEGRERKGQELSKRFNVAIDEAAMRAGLTESGAYLSQWRKSDWQEREGSLAETTAVLAGELEDAYPPERLRKLIAQFGLEAEIE
jgi:MarR-like DNA-binding transcriptional regulator SgrR of sgrS sRNA